MSLYKLEESHLLNYLIFKC
jgi:hypothetical protein